MPRAVVIANPASRRAVPPAMLEAALGVLGPSWETEVKVTRDSDGPTILGRHEAEQGAAVIFACGGDGTLNGVINGVRQAGRRDVAVGLIPAGTANVWAHEAGIPADPLAAVLLAQSGRTVDVDLGVVQVGDEPERRFLLMCSFGFDAAVVRRVEGRPGLKRRLAQGAFVVAGAGAVAIERPVPATGDWDEVRPERSVFIGVAGNSRLYGGVSQLTSDARMDDGLLDLALFEARQGAIGILDATTHLARGMARGKRPWHDHRAARFEYRRGPRFTLTPQAPLDVQVDGEFFTRVQPEEPMRLSSDPMAIRLLVPDAPSPLYGQLSS
ncbi:MAG: hypothetical protein KC472_03515 [Dehalococcoidia bacterium]|nr:hypothetical protein [Dehalococcoidia bacterium]